MFIFDGRNESRLNFISEILALLSVFSKMGILLVGKRDQISAHKLSNAIRKCRFTDLCRKSVYATGNCPYGNDEFRNKLKIKDIDRTKPPLPDLPPPKRLLAVWCEFAFSIWCPYGNDEFRNKANAEIKDMDQTKPPRPDLRPPKRLLAVCGKSDFLFWRESAKFRNKVIKEMRQTEIAPLIVPFFRLSVGGVNFRFRLGVNLHSQSGVDFYFHFGAGAQFHFGELWSGRISFRLWGFPGFTLFRCHLEIVPILGVPVTPYIIGSESNPN